MSRAQGSGRISDIRDFLPNELIVIRYTYQRPECNCESDFDKRVKVNYLIFNQIGHLK